MKHFKNFQKHLRNENTDLPSDLSWEAMEEGIFGEVNKPRKVIGYKRFFTYTNALILVLSLLSIILAHQLYITNNEDSKNHQIANKNQRHNSPTATQDNTALIKSEHVSIYQTDESSVPQSSSQTNRKNTLTIAESNTNTKESNLTQARASSVEANTNDEDLNQNNLKIQNPSSISIAENNQEENTSKRFTKKRSTEKKERERRTTNQDEKNIPLTSNPISTKGNQSNSLLETENNNANNKARIQFKEDYPIVVEAKSSESVTNNISRSKEYASLSILDLIYPTVIYKRNKIQVAKISSQDIFTEHKSIPKSSPISITVSGGSNHWRFGNQNTTSSIYDFTNTQVGASFGATINYAINNKWSIQSGLDYDVLNSKLDAKIVSLSRREIPNAVISTSHNAISGNPTTVRRDTFVYDTTTLTVIHHNSYKSIHLPIQAYWSKKSNKWSAGLGFGPSIHWLRSYEGRYIQNENYADFTSDDQLYDNKVVLSLSANLYLERNLSRHIAMGVNLGINQHIQSWSSDKSNSMKPTILRNQVYMRYSF